MSDTCIFESYNIIDALKMVRDTLGPDAKIITTKKIKPFLGIGREKIQIIAQKKQDNIDILTELQKRIENLTKSIEELREKNIIKDNLVKFIKKNISADFAYELATISTDIKEVFNYFEKNFKEAKPLQEKPYLVIGPKSCGKTSFIKAYLKKIKKKNTFYVKLNKIAEFKKINNGFLMIEANILNKTDIQFITKLCETEKNSFGLIICFEASKYSIAKEWSREFSSFDDCLKVITKIDEVKSNLIVFDTAKKLPGEILCFTRKHKEIIKINDFEKNKYIDYFINEIYEDEKK